MTIDVSSIIEAKLAQMEKDGIIQKKIEEVLEKNILSAIASVKRYTASASVE